jgi:hypothetical protein
MSSTQQQSKDVAKKATVWTALATALIELGRFVAENWGTLF